MRKQEKTTKAEHYGRGNRKERITLMYIHTLIRSRNADLYMPEIYRH